jgi:hypothetical protein
MNRTIKNIDEFNEFTKEIRNRQFEDNPIMVDLSNIFHIEKFNWGKEFLEITRIENMDIVNLIKKQKTT